MSSEIQTFPDGVDGACVSLKPANLVRSEKLHSERDSYDSSARSQLAVLECHDPRPSAATFRL
ncbi:hypothetical protein PHBOTO_005907 [Pseudozyma hubeiensis]|nr:hypothetical protein PHBOTO_005907 [Pseudozyma hubeiensis]